MITFANGQSYETTNIFGSKMLYQGQQREVLQIDIESSNISFEAAKEIYTSESCLKDITISDGENEYLYLNYVIPVELVFTSKRKLYGMDDDTNVISIKVAQKSALEITQDQQATDIANIEAALIELAEMEATNNG